MPRATCTRCHGLTDLSALGWLNISLSAEDAAGWGGKFCWCQILVAEGCLRIVEIHRMRPLTVWA